MQSAKREQCAAYLAVEVKEYMGFIYIDPTNEQVAIVVLNKLRML